MACISRIVNETSHHQGWESNTLRKGSQAKDMLQYYLIIPSHSLFNQTVFPVQHFTDDYRLSGGRGHLLAAFVQPLKQWGHVLDEEEFLHARDADDARMLTGRAKEHSHAEMLLHSRVEGLFACLTYSKLAGVWSWPSKEYVHEILQPDSSFLCPLRCFHIGKCLTCIGIAPATRND